MAANLSDGEGRTLVHETAQEMQNEIKNRTLLLRISIVPGTSLKPLRPTISYPSARRTQYRMT